MWGAKQAILLLLTTLIPGSVFASRELPAPKHLEGDLELHNTIALADYNPRHKQADWVFYPLGLPQLRSCTERKNEFRPDPRLRSQDSAKLSDYENSGFDRGHLNPAGDNKWSQDAMRESFYLSNVSPQPGRFNRGIWNTLENLVRAWAKDKGGLWVTTGPLLTDSLHTIGRSEVSVPEYYYKVLATQRGDRHEAVAFLLPVDAHSNLSRYAMPVKKLEEISRIDFLSGLNDEGQAESQMNLQEWNFQATFSYLPCKALSPEKFDWSWGLSPL